LDVDWSSEEEFGRWTCTEWLREGLTASEVAFIFVVVASIGSDLLEVVFPSVMAKDGDLAEARLPPSLSLTIDAVSEAASVAFEMPSRATWATGAALRGQLVYHDYRAVLAWLRGPDGIHTERGLSCA
jgi:hypothetical protein